MNLSAVGLMENWTNVILSLAASCNAKAHCPFVCARQSVCVVLDSCSSCHSVRSGVQIPLYQLTISAN